MDLASAALRCFLNLQKLVSIFWIRKHARLMFPEYSITIAGDDLVDSVPYRFRQYFSNAHSLPNTAQLSQDVDDCIGSRQQVFSWATVVHDDVDRIKVFGVSAVTQGQRLGEPALKGRKAKPIMLVALQQKLIEAIA
jgi:hypothetical protein